MYVHAPDEVEKMIENNHEQRGGREQLEYDTDAASKELSKDR